MWNLLTVLACSTPAPPEAVELLPAPAKAPDVVVILIDTLRVDRLGIYGSATDPMPFLSTLAADSAVFEHAWSTSSWTAPSTASVFTGLYPNQHGVTAGLVATRAMQTQGEADQESTLAVKQLPSEVPSLPQVFKAQGYTTFAVTTNININEELGFDRGFDHFQFFQDGSARQVAETVLSWQPLLEAEGPSLLYLHFNDAHSPYLARDPWFVPSEDAAKSQLSAYESELQYLDLYLSRLFETMGWNEDTIVLLVSDHGEAFGEHGQSGHHFSLYRELNQVLWMAHAPGVKPGRYTQNVSLVDVLPTALGLAEARAVPGRSGADLSDLLHTGKAPNLELRTVFAHRWDSAEGDLWAAVRGDWRLISKDSGKQAEAEEPMLFSVRQDPGEIRDLRSVEIQAVMELQTALDTFRADPGETWEEVQEVTLDPMQIEMLKQLGYLEP